MQMSSSRDESAAEVRTYLHEKEINFSYSTFLKDSIWRALGDSGHYLNAYKFKRGVEPSPIQLRVYDRQGNFITGYSQCYGSFKKLNVLDGYPPRVIPHLPNNRSLVFEDELKLFVTPPSTQLQIIEDASNSDYIMVLYWNIWSAYFSEIVLRQASDFMLKYNTDSTRLTLILVNTGIEL